MGDGRRETGDGRRETGLDKHVIPDLIRDLPRFEGAWAFQAQPWPLRSRPAPG